MSIFGIKKIKPNHLRVEQELHKTRKTVLERLNLYNEQRNNLQDRVRNMYVEHRLLANKLENLSDKRVIVVIAETKGSLQKGELFSFGNGGKSSGYVCNFPANIFGMSLSCERKAGDITVAILVNGKEKQGYDITISRPTGHDNYATPWRVNAGDTINFISKSNNGGAENTVVSLIMELIF